MFFSCSLIFLKILTVFKILSSAEFFFYFSLYFIERLYIFMELAFLL